MSRIQRIGLLRPTAIAAAVSMLAACGTGTDGGTSQLVVGVVNSSAFTAGSSADPTIAASNVQGALVCVDSNGNGKCDASEFPATTDGTGKFSMTVPAGSFIIADVGTGAILAANKANVSTRTVFRASGDQLAEQDGAVVVSPLSTEVVRMMEANGTTYAAEKQNLATRLGVPAGTVLSDVNTAGGSAKTALLAESNALGNRFAYAITKLDRGDLFPDALAVPGGDPRLTGTRWRDSPHRDDARHPQADHVRTGAAGRVQRGRDSAL